MKFISAETGADDQSLAVYARKNQGYNPQEVTAVSGATCTVVNTGVIITTNDLVIVQHINGTVDYRTVAAATDATKIVLSSAPSVTFAAGMKIYEIGQIGNIKLGITNANGIATLNQAGDALFVTPKDSPLRVIMNGSTNNAVSVTAE